MSEERESQQVDKLYVRLESTERMMVEGHTRLVVWREFNRLVKEGVIVLNDTEKKYARYREAEALGHFAGMGLMAVHEIKEIAQANRFYAEMLADVQMNLSDAAYLDPYETKKKGGRHA